MTEPTQAHIDRIEALLREHGVIDGHNDLLWEAREKVDYDFDRFDLLDSDTCRGHGAHTDLPRMRAGGMAAQFWSVFVPATLTGGAAVTATLEQIDAGHRMISAVRRASWLRRPRSRTSSGRDSRAGSPA